MVDGGTCYGIVGDNGSGKTTFANTIIGLVPEYIPARVEGTMLLDSMELSGVNLRSRLEYVGYVFQDLESQILFGTVAQILGLDEVGSDKELLKRCIDELKIEHLLTRDAETLSTGERKRVALATAVRLGPDLLIYDEANAALDEAGREQLQALLTYLIGSQKAVLLLGQRERVLPDTRDKTMFLNRGQLVHDKIFPGKPLDIPWTDMIPEKTCPSIGISDLYYSPGKASEFVLGPLDMRIDAGETVAVVGSNGSGKTTLLELIAGVLQPHEGEILINGRSEKRRSDIGYVLQDPSLNFIGTTVEEEIDNARVEGSTDVIKRIVTRVLGVDRISDDPLALSFGQQRMLSFILELVTCRGILVCDEIDYGLDSIYLAEIEKLLRLNLQENVLTILFVTHDSEFARKNSNRHIRLKNGALYYASQVSDVAI